MKNKKEYFNTAKKLQKNDAILQIHYLIKQNHFETALNIMQLHKVPVDDLQLTHQKEFKSFIEKIIHKQNNE